MSLQSINPTTGRPIQTYSEHTPDQVKTLLNQAFEAWKDWKETDFHTRAIKMKRAAQILREKKDFLAELMALEMGKPIQAGRGEAEKCAWVCEYYAEQAEAMLSPVEIEAGGRKSYICYNPLGPVLAIMPWNFPLWQVFRFAAPALMGGNVGVLKHAPNVPGCSIAIEEIFQQAGFPKGVFSQLLLQNEAVAAVIENPVIQAVTLTGSTRAGKAVAAQAGAVLKKTVLELGGSDPYLILEDADLHQAAQICASSRLINSGQSCIAAKRFLVVESVREQFETYLVEAMSKAVMGDPRQEATTVGPQARQDLRDELVRQVKTSISQGARCLLGGELPQGEGFYYPPTVLTDVKPGMVAFEEELFGPVAAIVPVKDEAEAIDLANRSAYGLGAAVFSQDLERAEQIAAHSLEAGACFVNAFVASDPRLPFGGIKESGYGRELSDLGLKEFMNIKTVFIK
ncbi:succinate-semialdehyde dehydrogenase [bacterium (Candidatus Blackallbacteria) CG17_big_fil_post_rev_8_21_14_2_50_48_46]|uniref:Succinate-semialdehyde dehydrogenase n=1 Tax=bacterium (Candidatus Blackallbacteria) CG17_big_fil_post_rev_8_21_14_2_50_48_46 TaxID=2014261 RepID=A0A2M7G5G8_9BACT|nr:MAG: succinate-semialdehyde dehydrogenase [bacterium (Candidatus Blackallbacteria) CG18_big_fil_WC_8_21_14_2_50_49_26]PIW17244.1 MAG: succinate-semialdehyde dehydrogenase [bacterium (Candidatus Blackallbacteria) CG17_big_fil_post_rev_8_21_14_2_50_48_46]PIW51036.1 MAG: succinate-semialdehyde dehydrogenase [bacterium (Candidatus Blackallbacteria) CG13_big_fil_rev_8_21_14_2_50_49_14]